MIKLEIMSWEKGAEYMLKAIQMNADTINSVCKYIASFESEVKTMIDVLELAKKEETTINDIPDLSMELTEHLDFTLTLLPGLPIMYPEINWQDFINSLLSIADNYIGTYKTVVLSKNDKDIIEKIYSLEIKIMRCAKNIEFGATIENLVPVLVTILHRFEHTQSINPYALELSREYLEALKMPINNFLND